MRRAFDGVYVSGLEELRATATEAPVIIAANHVAWWDAFMVVLMDQLLGTDGYCLMDADNLKKLPFFSWIGAIPLRRGSPRESLRDLQQASTMLDRPGRALWIFPQGEQRPAHLRPLGLSSGVHMLARRSGAKVVTASLQYAFREQPQPSALMTFGPALPSDLGRSDAMGALETRLIDGLNRIDRFVVDGGEQFEAVIEPRVKSSVPAGGRLLASCATGRGMEHG
jgi:1-acyl-sn-glycerol-3-phosphate acyltransferase